MYIHPAVDKMKLSSKFDIQTVDVTEDSYSLYNLSLDITRKILNAQHLTDLWILRNKLSQQAKVQVYHVCRQKSGHEQPQAF